VKLDNLLRNHEKALSLSRFLLYESIVVEHEKGYSISCFDALRRLFIA
jgi:hypothetical protein